MNPSPAELPQTNQSIPTQPIHSTPSPSPSPPPSKPSFNKLFFILGIILLILLATGSAFILGKSQNNPRVTSSNLSPTSYSPSPTPDPTANWKTYTNAKYKFSFQFPQESSINGNGENYSANKLLGYDVAIKGANFDMSADLLLGLPSESVIKSNEIITINGIKWSIRFIDTKGNCLPDSGPCTPILEYQTEADGNLFTFTFRGDYPNRTFPHQILSTFKFINGQNNTPTINNPSVITTANNGQTLTYTATSRFSFNLDPNLYPISELKNTNCLLLGTVSNLSINGPDNYPIGFEAVHPGKCVIKNNDFSVTIIVISNQ